DYDANDLQCKDNSNSQYKVCNGFFSYNYAVLAKYGTKGKNHQILQNDALFDGNEKAEGYFKHDNCMEKTCSQFCSQCASLASNEAFNKRNRPILPGIPPLVLAIIPLNQKETKSDVFFENNTILKELIKLNAKPIGLYFDGHAHHTMVVLKERCSCIKTLWKSGVRKVGDLHNATGFLLKTLYRWTKQLKETNNLKQRSHPGRPKRLTPIQRRYLSRIAKSQKYSSSIELTENIKKKYPDLDIAPRTVRENLQVLG
ncbi:6669_t:CDS:2, partial [Funneliformis geosporum]